MSSSSEEEDKTNYEETKRKINTLISSISDPLQLFIEALKIPSNERCKDVINCIYPYLMTLPNFVQSMSIIKEYNTEDIIKKLCYNLHYQQIQKGKLISRLNEKEKKFYIILKGKVASLSIKYINCYLNEEEYITFLIKLLKHNEIELIHSCIGKNKKTFNIGNNFEQWMNKHIENYQKGNIELKYSEDFYATIINQYKIAIIRNKEKNDIELTPEIYINYNRIDNDKLDSNLRKNVMIPLYQNDDRILEDRDHFGYFALDNHHIEQEMTFISLSQCELAEVDMEEYENFLIKKTKKQQRNLSYLLNEYSLFERIPKNTLEKKYASLFKHHKYKVNIKIFNNGDIIDYKYFLKGGEFEISVNLNIIEVNELICKLKKIKMHLNSIDYNNLTSKKKIELNAELHENDGYLINKTFALPEYNQLIFDKRHIKLSIIKDRDILGLLDTVYYIDNTALFDCTCLSYKNSVYIINSNDLEMIEKNEERVKNEIKKFSLNKIDFYISRLNKHKATVFNEYNERNFYNNKQINNTNKFNTKGKSTNLKRVLINKREEPKKKIVIKLPNIIIQTNPMNYEDKKETRKEKQNRLEMQIKEAQIKKKAHRYNNLNRKIISNIDKHKIQQTRSPIDICKSIIQEKFKYTRLFSSLMHEKNHCGLSRLNSEESNRDSISSNKDSIISRFLLNNFSEPNIFHRKNFNAIGVPTQYPIGNDKKVNIVDCLIMDKVNYLYSMGVIK